MSTPSATRTGDVVIGAVMEHVEEAGVHSGDSACVIPPPTLGAEVIEVIEGYTRAIAEALEVRGPINVQFAVKSTQVFVIEANPRASRTVPFVSKATGVALARAAARVMAGATLDELRARGTPAPARERGPRERQGSGAALRPFSRRRHPARSRDAIDGRGHGHRSHLRAQLRQEPDGGGGPAARVRLGVPLAGRPGQAGGPASGDALRRARLLDRRDRGNGGLPRGAGRPGGDDRGQGRIR